jgi:hemoglobin
MTGELTPYEAIGGDAAVRALVDRFYDLMELEPKFAALRSAASGAPGWLARQALHVSVGLAGRSDLYIERHGHPMLRARHLPFPIASTERAITGSRACAQAMDDTHVPAALKDPLMQAFLRYRGLDAQPRGLTRGARQGTRLPAATSTDMPAGTCQPSSIATPAASAAVREIAKRERACAACRVNRSTSATASPAGVERRSLP